MTLLLNSNLPPCVAHLLHQLNPIPTRKLKPPDSNDIFVISKSARLALKTNKNLSNVLIHLDPPKLSEEEKKLHKDPPLPTGRSPKDIYHTPKNPNILDNKIIDICANKTPLDGNSPSDQYPDNTGTHTTLAQEIASPYPITITT